ncbi:GlxA family transcriptional regulator [Sinomicrobium weinanense]|uniref:Helix-turn-helix domain-containing protein n=1 Tax=Sinomicrobium weinanense TaxID=2842200 RepID=A0A926JUK6_9FLAO|nr:helix-turn-helix domain-containing protein [Sinomicrobium weinanense]MBC9797835.1 helix-turn-helix domain-containing protein [Sinomicrobium weinanense]MBU3124670.1 helix-turn-helix domain-containing protein [Sinomicrobium weinanense]
MKKISLLVYEDAVLSALSGAVDIFIGTNRFMEASGNPGPFKLELVSEKAKNIQLFAPARFICHRTLAEVKQTDLIVVPAFNGDAGAVLEKNRGLVNWISTMREKGAEVASLCFGSYFLAEAGLLSGKPCTSHWLAIPDMRQRYQDIDLMPDMVITDQEGVYTSGGAFSSLNLILYLVEKFCGRETGVQVSKMFSIDMDRVNQAHFSVFQGQHQHDDKEVLGAQKYIEKNYYTPISIEEIAERANMSKRNFIRRFKNATQNTPLEYLQRVKIEAAKKALEKSAESINSVIYDVGYNDLKTFRKVFKRVTGLTPQDYRRKYSRG